MELTLTNKEIRNNINEFNEIYSKKPLNDNQGGMKAPHMMGTFSMVRNLNPNTIIESGVWFGQGTWMLDQSAPNAQLHCIEPIQNGIKIKIDGSKHYSNDFSTLDFSELDKDETLIFFDDHQNAFERIKQCKEMGFKHLIFEDNYPPNQGDCVSIKKIMSNKNYVVGRGTDVTNVSHNPEDTDFLNEWVDIYYEFPPLFNNLTTRWGDDWSDEIYPTKDPILDTSEKNKYPTLWEERLDYTWICYVKLK
jgi:hypothetical protein